MSTHPGNGLLLSSSPLIISPVHSFIACIHKFELLDVCCKHNRDRRSLSSLDIGKSLIDTILIFTRLGDGVCSDVEARVRFRRPPHPRRRKAPEDRVHCTCLLLVLPSRARADRTAISTGQGDRSRPARINTMSYWHPGACAPTVPACAEI